MNRHNAIMLRHFLEHELTPILKKAGYTFVLGNASFDENMVHFKGFKISEIGAKPEMLRHLERENEYRIKLGDNPLSLDRVVPVGNRKYKLVGFKPRARKKQYVMQDIKTEIKYVTVESEAERLFAINK